MADTTSGKVSAAHLTRDAYLYVRQSTLQQLVQNTESTKRQYDLRQRAVEVGPRIVFMSSTAIWGNQGLAPPTVLAFNNW